ncbi:MAG: glycosyltransferase [Phycisphaerales bacterium]|nr:glycosyltransferase [Phycisphaerales bacterium]
MICAPSILGDSFGVFAALSFENPGLLRVLAVNHSDTPYNDLVCTHYAPVVSAFVGVSDRLTERLRSRLPSRSTEVFGIGYGVETPETPAPREPLQDRPIRLLYCGRMDHEQKRVLALVALTDELARRGTPHELALIGDGPAAQAIDEMALTRPTIRRFPAASPPGIASALGGADLFLLPSRYEGLSVALLEAMARGCIPVLTPSDSGTDQLIADGRTGFLADAGPDAGDETTGLALADAVERAIGAGDASLVDIRVEGHALILGRFAVDRCAARYGAVIDRIARSAPRAWPSHLPAAFTGPGGGGSGTVPHDAPERLSAALAGLAGRSIAVYGVGRHTLELREVFERSPATIVAFLDDDAARQGASLWGIPITAPEEAGAHGAEDILISSWLHQRGMAARCAARTGARVHTLYPETSAPSTNPRLHSQRFSSRCC